MILCWWRASLSVWVSQGCVSRHFHKQTGVSWEAVCQLAQPRAFCLKVGRGLQAARAFAVGVGPLENRTATGFRWGQHRRRRLSSGWGSFSPMPEFAPGSSFVPVPNPCPKLLLELYLPLIRMKSNLTGLGFFKVCVLFTSFPGRRNERKSQGRWPPRWGLLEQCSCDLSRFPWRLFLWFGLLSVPTLLM